jgi:hypothetical protein
MTLRELAAKFGVHRTVARKWLMRESALLGIQAYTARTLEGGMQAEMAWRREDAERLITRRRELGWPVNGEAGTPVWTRRVGGGD